MCVCVCVCVGGGVGMIRHRGKTHKKVSDRHVVTIRC